MHDHLRVDLIILGAQKCATTSLFHMLSQHPMICASRIKETNFFADRNDWRCELHHYHALFDPKPGQILMEASPAYTILPFRNFGIWEDIYAYNPEVKLIYNVRNPIDRIISGYMHRYQRGLIDMDIHKAIARDGHLLAATAYYSQIIPYIRRFGRENVLILDFDDIVHDWSATSARIAEFVSLSEEPFAEIRQQHMNKGVDSDKRQMMWDRGPYGMLKKAAPKIWRRISRINRRPFHEIPSLSKGEKSAILHLLDLQIDHLEPLIGKSLRHWKTIS